MSTLAEVKATIANRQGLSCETYFALSTRTAHLRESLYISVRDGDKLFLPRGAEHFPVQEIEAHYLGRMKLGYTESIGAGGRSPILFACEGATEEAAEEGARLINGTLAELEPLLLESLIPRTLASIPHKKLYRATMRSERPPYRPEVLPERGGVPVPVTEEELASRRPGITPEAAAALLRNTESRVEEHKRGLLKRWGLLEEAERYGFVGRTTPKARSNRAAPASPWQQASWQQSSWS